MSKFKNALNARDNHIQTLRAACGIMLVLLVLSMLGWMTAPRNLTIHNPPDLRSGSSRPWWEIPPSTVYAFSFYIFQQLNSWPKDGDVDYPYRIETLSAYLTPTCKELLHKDAKQRKDLGESRDRVRGVSEIPERGYRDDSVTIIDRDNWQVRLDLVTDEYVNSEPVKRSLVRYPLKVVRWDKNPEANPFGLALDCLSEAPQRLEAAPVVKEENKGVFN
ncbi:TIGR03746 family integrating conjugative element protein [Salmonella enterica]|uniref:TIGR03746 family integrating conjugative element protein n=1 Tax=Salmonella enterica TaxID=28901 RepID=A0A754G2R8_SALER|nr:TIGR03746 family integrating conjugative element protein [Salmonella enterica]EBR8476702.1 TIGR03746 family integrating conjugative element protein [Salmonella enterica subsp. enterica serovar Nima]EBV7250904.1 TIGR03746 family integrating conjugative element protein [Salmonella enterica subsp. enterica serovar Pomona]EDS7028577.1 TIGR03746 family integrating conjugative element protein [Salmonella enterica subsp. enterica]EAW2797152.1 TIGR03746 family integrating conjugative element protein